MFPACESCSADSKNAILEADLVFLYKISDKEWFIQRVINYEILRIYSTPIINDIYVINAQSDILDDLLAFII